MKEDLGQCGHRGEGLKSIALYLNTCSCAVGNNIILSPLPGCMMWEGRGLGWHIMSPKVIDFLVNHWDQNRDNYYYCTRNTIYIVREGFKFIKPPLRPSKTNY